MKTTFKYSVEDTLISCNGSVKAKVLARFYDVDRDEYYYQLLLDYLPTPIAYPVDWTDATFKLDV